MIYVSRIHVPIKVVFQTHIPHRIRDFLPCFSTTIHDDFTRHDLTRHDFTRYDIVYIWIPLSILSTIYNAQTIKIFNIYLYDILFTCIYIGYNTTFNEKRYRYIEKGRFNFRL